MAECQCGAVWLWDWCGDCYVKPSGEEYTNTELETEGTLINVWSCDCGRVKGASHNGEVCDNFDNVDWELDEHSFGGGEKMSQEEKDTLFKKAKELDEKWRQKRSE